MTHFDDNGYAEVRKDGKYGLINTDGEFVIPCIYDELRRLKNIQYAVVRINEKWGVIDVNDHVLVPFIYDRAYNPGYKMAIGLSKDHGTVLFTFCH